MRLLVTGASGFIGRNLLRAIPEHWLVTATYNRSADLPAFIERLGRATIVPFQVDLTESDAATRLKSSQGAFDACVFLAANGDPALSVAKPAFDLRSNTISCVQLLEALHFERLIYFSSGAVYDGMVGAVSPRSHIAPLLPYSISKFASEQYLRHFRGKGRIGNLFIVRFFGAYGPWEAERKIYGRLVRRFAIERDPRFAIRGNGRNFIDAMYIDDAVRAILQLLATSGEGEVVDCASGNPVSLTALVETAARLFGLQPEITYEGQVPEYIEFHSVDDTMRTKYGFVPAIPLGEGLQRFADFLRTDSIPPAPGELPA